MTVFSAAGISRQNVHTGLCADQGVVLVACISAVHCSLTVILSVNGILVCLPPRLHQCSCSTSARWLTVHSLSLCSCVCVGTQSSPKSSQNSQNSPGHPSPRSSTHEAPLTKLPSLLRSLEGRNLALVGSCQLPQVRRACTNRRGEFPRQQAVPRPVFLRQRRHSFEFFRPGVQVILVPPLEPDRGSSPVTNRPGSARSQRSFESAKRQVGPTPARPCLTLTRVTATCVSTSWCRACKQAVREGEEPTRSGFIMQTHTHTDKRRHTSQNSP